MGEITITTSNPNDNDKNLNEDDKKNSQSENLIVSNNKEIDINSEPEKQKLVPKIKPKLVSKA